MKKPHGAIVARYEYRSSDGAIGWRKNRHADKFMWWQHHDGKQYRKGYGPEKPKLYRLPEIIQSEAAASIHLPEGEKDADALAKLGYLSTTTPVSGLLYPGSEEYFRDRDVVIFEDNDSARREKINSVGRILSPIARSIRIVRFAEYDPDKTGYDVCRFLGEHSADDLAELIDAAPAWTAPPDDEKEGKKESTAEKLVCLALELYRLGRTDKGEAFAVEHDGPNVAVSLKGSARALRARLSRDYRAKFKNTPNASALTDAMCALEGEALDTEPEAVHLRVASHDGGVVVDLGDTEGRAVLVGPGGWKVLDRSPVLFRRTELTSALPVPERGGSIDELRDMLNVADSSWPLVLGWLVASLLPDIPHPILLLGGLQGTGKSSAARLLVLLVDPSGAPLRSEPRDVEGWQVAASGSWYVCIDNVSKIAPWFSDALCRAATGDGLVRRKLYTDSDISVLSFRRAIMLTSIDAGAIRGDLGERLLLVDLEQIGEDSRRTEADLDTAFYSRRPRLLGALLDAVSTTLAKLPEVRPEKMPRMADFSKVLMATDAAGVTRGAFDRFVGQQGRIAAEVVDADPFASAIVDLARRVGSWEGTATELIEKLLPEGVVKPPRAWPGRNGVAGRLKRLTPALTAQGVLVECAREANAQRRRLIEITTTRKASDQNVQIVHPQETTGESVDEVDVLDDISGTLSDGHSTNGHAGMGDNVDAAADGEGRMF